jgi:hypothetical protein
MLAHASVKRIAHDASRAADHGMTCFSREEPKQEDGADVTTRDASGRRNAMTRDERGGGMDYVG